MTNIRMDFSMKNIYTNKTHIYFCNSNFTIREFIHDVFQTYPYLDDLSYKEIVEAGQYNNVNGWSPELAPALEPSDDITLHQKYGVYWKNISFYLR